MYIRLTGIANSPSVYESDYSFAIGKAVTLMSGNDVAILAVGSGVAVAKGAAQILESAGISAEVVNMHTIKPLDTEVLDSLGDRFKRIYIIEEHSRIGGLGSAVADYYSENSSRPAQTLFSLPDDFGPTAEYNYLLDYYGLTSEKVAEKILKSTAT
jgi:transketolase